MISKKKQQEPTASAKPHSSMRVPAKTAILPAIPQNNSTPSNKFFPVPNKESVILANKLSSMDIKDEIDQNAPAKLSELHEMNMLIQKQQSQINALCRLAQQQTATIKEMEENQKKNAI